MKTISFRQDMIDLILAGKKTLTIRPIKPQPVRVEKPGLFGTTHYEWNGRKLAGMRDWFLRQCPYGYFGDVVLVREKAGLLLKIINVCVVRVDQVTTKEWILDGVEERYVISDGEKCYDADVFYNHWQSFYRGTDYDWKNKPYVWVIRFEVEP